MIEVFGAGMAGCYFACLLDQLDSVRYVVYEKFKNKPCPSFCAFGWANYSKVRKLCNLINIDSEQYILARPKKAIVNGVEFKIKDVVIFDKPRFISDLRDLINVVYKVPSSFCGDLIVDATGHYRALLGNDGIKYLTTKQAKVKTYDLDSEFIYIYAKPFGYAWAFPLSDIEWHIGAGGFTQEQVNFLIRNLNRTYGVRYDDVGCKCKSPIVWDFLRNTVPQANKRQAHRCNR